jgi:uncharacterized protein
LPAQPNGPVNDYAGALTPVQLSQLDAQLRGYERGTTRQIAVAVFRSLEGESLEDVSIRLAESWKIGGKKSNDGVLLTLFLDDHKLRIEVGYGLEGQLTDALCARIIREVMAPKLRQNDLFGALTAGVAAIDTATGGEKHAEGAFPKQSSDNDLGLEIFGVVFLLFIILVIVGARYGGGGGSGWTSGGGGWSSSDWSSSSSSSSDSGWSGGGGSFGGGGASGSW